MTDLDAQLQPAWRALTDTMGVAEAASQSVFTDLCRRYSEPLRSYHTLAHVAQMLRIVDEWGRALGAEDVTTLRLAVWFHDAVYDSRAADNEEQSARLARAVLDGWRVSADRAATVERLILTSKTHEGSDGDPAGALFLDADLATLGSEPVEYGRYSRAIRQEYAWVPEAGYREGRCRVLRRFLERPRLYRTPALSAAWESRARENLRAEIGRLSG